MTRAPATADLARPDASRVRRRGQVNAVFRRAATAVSQQPLVTISKCKLPTLVLRTEVTFRPGRAGVFGPDDTSSLVRSTAEHGFAMLRRGPSDEASLSTSSASASHAQAPPGRRRSRRQLRHHRADRSRCRGQGDRFANYVLQHHRAVARGRLDPRTVAGGHRGDRELSRRGLLVRRRRPLRVRVPGRPAVGREQLQAHRLAQRLAVQPPFRPCGPRPRSPSTSMGPARTTASCGSSPAPTCWATPAPYDNVNGAVVPDGIGRHGRPCRRVAPPFADAAALREDPRRGRRLRRARATSSSTTATSGTRRRWPPTSRPAAATSGAAGSPVTGPAGYGPERLREERGPLTGMSHSRGAAGAGSSVVAWAAWPPPSPCAQSGQQPAVFEQTEEFRPGGSRDLAVAQRGQGPLPARLWASSWRRAGRPDGSDGLRRPQTARSSPTSASIPSTRRSASGRGPWRAPTLQDLLVAEALGAELHPLRGSLPESVASEDGPAP